MKKRTCLAFLLSFALILPACSKAPETVEEPEVVEKEESKYTMTIGTETGKSKHIVLENKTGSAIKEVHIKANTDEEYSGNLLNSQEPLQDSETLEWFYTPKTQTAEENTEEENGDEKQLAPMYNVQFVLEDGKTPTLNCFTFEDVDGIAQIHIEDDVCYLTYKSLSSGESVSTLEQEKAELETAEDTAGDTELTEEETWQEPAYEEPVYQEPTYQEPVYQEPAPQPTPVPTPQPTPETPSVDVGNQGSEGCLGGAVVNP